MRNASASSLTREANHSISGEVDLQQRRILYLADLDVGDVLCRKATRQ